MQMQLHITNRVLIECYEQVIQILNNISGRFYCSTIKLKNCLFANCCISVTKLTPKGHTVFETI